MITPMFAFCHQLQILNSIVISNFVSMMSHFVVSQSSSQMFFHNDNAFHHITQSRSFMIRAIQNNIAIINPYSSFEHWVFRPTYISLFSYPRNQLIGASFTSHGISSRYLATTLYTRMNLCAHTPFPMKPVPTELETEELRANNNHALSLERPLAL